MGEPAATNLAENHIGRKNDYRSLCGIGEKNPSLRDFLSTAVVRPPGQRMGFWKDTTLRPGLWLSAMDVTPDRTIRIGYARRNPLITFGVVLAGNMWNKAKGSPAGDVELNGRAGAGGVVFLPGSEGFAEIPGRERLRMLHVHADAEVLHRLLGDDLGSLPKDLERIVEGSVHKSFVCHGKTDPAVQTVAHEMLHDPCHGMPKNMYLEGKALELISLQISWVGSQSGLRRTRPLLSPSEKERIHAAREILEEDLASPPTLSELSQRLCLSINKLELGFREIFGTSVFGFFKEYQMQKARLLLEQGDMNVSQVAWAVGYINVSHFGAAFRKRFGILPKSYLKKARTQATLP